MKYIAKTVVLFLALMLAVPASAQTPKKEFRGFWLSTAWRLTWPTKPIEQIGNAQQIQNQKDEMVELLDSVKAANCNVIYFQVRSRSDAMYKSSYEPWSSDLVATRGMDPGYDPLEFVIEESHKRGIEVHAWANPFRYESVLHQWDGTPQNYRESHPEWLIDHSDMSILNPGIPEVRDHVTAIIREIVTNYDIDGLVFDDYFYLSDVPLTADQEQYSAYNPDNLAQDAWRRQNINKFVAQIFNMIQEVKPYVKFGISPPGTWNSDANVADEYGVPPLNTGSSWAYYDIHCDPLAWIQQGSLDYISPQIYWTISNGYSITAEWWSEIVRMYGINFYASQTASDLTSAKAPARIAQQQFYTLGKERVPIESLSTIERQLAADTGNDEIIYGATASIKGTELVNQIKMTRSFDKRGGTGSMIYSMLKAIKTRGMLELLRSDVYKYPALIPATYWKPTTDPGLVSNIVCNNGILTWNGVENMRYAIYAVPNNVEQATACHDARYLLGLSYDTSYTLPEKYRSGYTYAIAIVDRYNNEYAPLFMGESIGKSPATTLIAPENNANKIGNYTFSWNAVDQASYYIDIARDEEFTHIVFSRETAETSLSALLLPDIAKGTYYWRVRTRKANCTDGISETRAFNGGTFEIESPARAATEVAITPTITWVAIPEAESYRLEINKYRDFRSMGTVLDQQYTENSITLPEGVMIGNTKYYARVTAYVGEIENTSKITYFTTLSQEPAIPVILFPTEGATVEAETLQVRWAEEPLAKTFRIELHTDDTFSPARSVKRQTVDAFVYETEFDNLTDGTWYLRARSEYAGGATEYCDTISFTFKSTSGIDLTKNDGNCYVISGENAALVMGCNAQHLTVDVANLSGQIVARFADLTNVTAGERIELNGLPRGVYAIVVHIDGKREILRLIR